VEAATTDILPLCSWKRSDRADQRFRIFGLMV
jgi:hypothetical protein